RGQEGDMTQYTGSLQATAKSDCDRIAARPVSEIMSAKVAALSFDDNLLTVQGIFASFKFRHLPVVDEYGEIIGIIYDRDFLRVVSPFFGTINEQNRDKEIMARKVGIIMTRNPICATADTTIMSAVRLMNGKKISCLPIVEKGSLKLLGIITWKDVVRVFCPRAFNPTRESNRLKAGVRVDPVSTESQRLRAKSASGRQIPAGGDTRTIRSNPPRSAAQPATAAHQAAAGNASQRAPASASQRAAAPARQPSPVTAVHTAAPGTAPQRPVPSTGPQRTAPGTASQRVAPATGAQPATPGTAPHRAAPSTGRERPVPTTAAHPAQPSTEPLPAVPGASVGDALFDE
ncbi:MAG: CBS domain-containing protein, partial [Planctomycetes bacterium]|nr:CBS domain-containing protein [Planctomycetota bacterium]